MKMFLRVYYCSAPMQSARYLRVTLFTSAFVIERTSTAGRWVTSQIEMLSQFVQSLGAKSENRIRGVSEEARATYVTEDRIFNATFESNPAWGCDLFDLSPFNERFGGDGMIDYLCQHPVDDEVVGFGARFVYHVHACWSIEYDEGEQREVIL